MPDLDAQIILMVPPQLLLFVFFCLFLSFFIFPPLFSFGSVSSLGLNHVNVAGWEDLQYLLRVLLELTGNVALT